MSENIKQEKRSSTKHSGLKNKFLSHVKVKKARSFSGRDKQKASWSNNGKQPVEDTATMSDTEGYTGRRTRPRRRTTGGSEAAADIETARKIGSTSDQEGQSTLNRQQIISMVKKRFGLRPEDSGLRLHPTVPEEEVPAVSPSPSSNSSPKHVKYETLLEKPGTYPTLQQKEEVPQLASGPQGVIYLQYGDEIKRAMLPGGMSNVEQVRDLFERSFPDKFHDRNNNRKTIYIKDTSCGIFYELDDVKDMSNKSHLKILESKPTQNGPIRSHSFNLTPNSTYPRYGTSTPTANHTQSPIQRPSPATPAYKTSTPLQDHSAVQPADEIQTGGGTVRYTMTTTKVTRMENGEEPTSHNFERSGSFMDKKKVHLPGLGAKLRTSDHAQKSKDPVEDQLDSLTSMLQDALKTESMDSIPTVSSGSSQYSTGSTEASSKIAPAPPPRASSKLAARDKEKFSQTLQRDSPSRMVKRGLSLQYGTLPAHSSPRTTRTTVNGREPFQRPIQRTMSAGSSTSGASTVSGSSSPVTVKYEGGTNVHDKDQLHAKAQGLRQDLGNLRAQLGQLRQLQTYQAKAFDNMLRNAKEQIVRSVARLSPVDEPPVRIARKRVHIEEMSYHKTKNEVNRNISELESEVEMLRMDVIQKRGLTESNQVTGLSNQLEIVSRQIADLRGNFTELHDNMKSVMAGELEIIVQGEKFLKEEPSKLDSMVSRCKHVTGTLFTLRKLIAAQAQMQSESQVSIDFYEGDHRNGESTAKAKPRVRFNDEAKTHYR